MIIFINLTCLPMLCSIYLRLPMFCWIYLSETECTKFRTWMSLHEWIRFMTLTIFFPSLELNCSKVSLCLMLTGFMNFMNHMIMFYISAALFWWVFLRIVQILLFVLKWKCVMKWSFVTLFVSIILLSCLKVLSYSLCFCNIQL